MNALAAETEDTRRVVASIEGPIGWLWIENMARMNAMSLSMWRDLSEGIDRFEDDPAVRVVVIAGRGGRAFCAGGDITEFAEHRSGAAAMQSYDAVGKAAMQRLEEIAKPTLAMIEGYCLGGGVALALRCDLRIAADNAKLGIPAAKRGLSYDFPSIKWLAELVGPSNAKHILYTGRSYGVAEAVVRGLVNEVVPAAELESHTHALAASIANNAPLSLIATKLIVNMTTRDPDQRDLAACKAAEQKCLSSEDYAESTRAFMEKRPPKFVGR